MSRGRVLGLDPGARRVGVALSDPAGIIAQPLAVIDRSTADVDQVLRALIAEYEVATIVVGLPRSLQGREATAAEAAREFGEQVGEVTGIEVQYQDERFTSKLAENALLEAGMGRRRRREIRDKIAAAVMLQSYLDRRARTEE